MVWETNQGKSEISVTKSRGGEITSTSDLGDHQDICPRCGARVNSLESHIVMDCSLRSEAVVRSVSRIVSMTAPSDLQPLAVLKLEVESVVAQFEDIEAGAGDKLLMLGQITDKKYNSLPGNFSRDFLWRVPDRFSEDVESEEFLHKFDVWSEYIERLAGPEDVQDLITQYEDIISKSSDCLQWKPRKDTDLYSRADVPASQILSKLETELGGVGGLSACPRDLESAVKELQGLLD